MNETATPKKATLIHSSRGLPARKTPVALPRGIDGQAILHKAITLALKTYLANHDLLKLQAARFEEGDAHTVFVYVPELDQYMRVSKTARLAPGIRIAAFDLLLALGYYLDPLRHNPADALIASLFKESNDAPPVRLQAAIDTIEALQH